MNEEEKSRREFIAMLGGPVRVAKALGLRSHSVVSNWRKEGFPHSPKQGLLEMAKRLDVEPHPELFLPRKTWDRNPPTPLSLFIKELAKVYGGFEKLHEASGIPLMSLKSMRQRSKSIMLMHVPALEKAANDVGVPLPDGWDENRRRYAEFAKRWADGQKIIDGSNRPAS